MRGPAPPPAEMPTLAAISARPTAPLATVIQADVHDAREKAGLGACPSSHCSTGRESGSLRGMSKHFRPWKIDEAQLLPPSVHDYVPAGHLSRLIVALVRESLDLCVITGSYTSGLGQLRPTDDNGAAAQRLCERHLLLAPDRQGGRGTCRLQMPWPKLR